MHPGLHWEVVAGQAPGLDCSHRHKHFVLCCFGLCWWCGGWSWEGCSVKLCGQNLIDFYFTIQGAIPSVLVLLQEA